MSERTLRQRFFARYSKHFWTKVVPIANRMSPKLLSRLSGGLGPDEFAQIIAQATDEQLEEAMQGKMRGVMLDEIVDRMEEEFQAERADNLDVVIQFNITGLPDGGYNSYQLLIRDNTCATSKGEANEPSVTVTVDAVNFLKMTSGVVTGIDLYLGGQLKMDGAMMMLTRLTYIFNIPTPEAEPKAA